jgi:ribose 5-phosphate isomerase RpiB
MARFDRADCAIGNLLALCEAVAGGGVGAGVALVPYGADAMVLANKVKGVRAVQGTRATSVAAGVRRFGANVLVLEHAFLTFHEMRSMIQAFVAGQGLGSGNAIVDAMNELEAR